MYVNSRKYVVNVVTCGVQIQHRTFGPIVCIPGVGLSWPVSQSSNRYELCCYRYNTRHVALKVAYLGWDYQGFVVQEDTERTVEAALFEALIKTRLVESRYGDVCLLVGYFMSQQHASVSLGRICSDNFM